MRKQVSDEWAYKLAEAEKEHSMIEEQLREELVEAKAKVYEL
jgi:hypothetical protein